MSECSRVGIWDPDRTGLSGRGRDGRGKQTQTKEKKFFRDSFKSFARYRFLTAGFPVGLVLLPLSPSQTLRVFTPLPRTMRFHISQLLAGVLATVSVVNAHVKVVYPALRGPDVSKDQILFCG